MTGRIFTADHHVYDLPPLLSWNVRHTGTVPCDSWSVTAVYQPEMLTVLRMAAGFAATPAVTTPIRVPGSSAWSGIPPRPCTPTGRALPC